MTKIHFLCLLFVCICRICFIYAGPVYVCDFEDDSERTQWVLNPTANAQKLAELKNQWFIGELGNFSPSGHNGLYISDDNGASANYNTDKAMWVMAYRSLTLPKGTYNLYFDWKALGKTTGLDAIRVFWVPDADSLSLLSGNGPSIPARLTDYELDTIPLYLALSWQYAKKTFYADGQSGKLVFVWTNSANNAKNPAGCIDNIEIHPINDCTEPKNVSHTANAGIISLKWGGKAEYYTVRAYDPRTKQWYVFDHVTSNTLDIPNMSEGVHTFYIRAHCGDDMSAYIVYTSFIVFAGTRCVDYMTLSNKNCFIGYVGNTKYSPACIDYGYADVRSRHTIHYLEDEYDPRTNYHLKTVPLGELASVRLGNWDVNAESEKVEYQIFVEEGMSDILKIKYAIVMNTPTEYHAEAVQAHFTLEILDGDAHIDKECSSADFSAGYGDMTGWSEEATFDGSNTIVLWKDWTEIAVSLRSYIGRTIKIRLTTMDCAAGGHYGYVYFTLNCESGELQGLSCGETNLTFKAPDNFKYRWYRADDPNNILSTKQTYTLSSAADTMTYIVDVINKVPTMSGRECYYQLEANSLPRFPVAKMEYVHSTAECQHIITFHNQSFIRIHNEYRTKDKDYADTHKPDSFLWNFGDGETKHTTTETYVKHAYPANGGSYQVTLYAYLSNGACVDSCSIPLNLPDVSSVEHHIDKHICEGESWSYNNQYYFNSFTDTILYHLDSGCDSMVIVNLIVHEQIEHQDTLYLCQEDLPFRYFDGIDTIEVAQSGTYKGKFQHQYSEDCICDSISNFVLSIQPPLRVIMADTIKVCPDNQLIVLPYLVEEGLLDSVYVELDSLVFGTLAQQFKFAAGQPIEIPIIHNVKPGRYSIKLTWIVANCSSHTETKWVEITYPTSMFGQKPYNGWIGMLKSDSTQMKYQWYKDGELIPGGNMSYIPVTQDDVGHTFTVVITQSGEVNGISSCPIVYGTATKIDNAPTINQRPRKVFRDGKLIIITNDIKYDILGLEIDD